MENEQLKKELLNQIIRSRIEVPNLKHVVYQKAIVTFFDLMGFRAAIEKRSAREIAQALSIFYYTSVNHSNAKTKSVSVHLFSDSVVRIRLIQDDRDLTYGYDPSPLIMEIYDLATIQFELACWYGLIVRGGMTIGNIFSQEGMVFGPALVRAYEIESIFAKYPRILVDKAIFVSLKSERQLLTIMDERSKSLYAGGAEFAELDYTAGSLSDALIIDEHKCISIDYLNQLIKGADLNFLTAHQNMIISSFWVSTNGSIKDKYSWLAHYHNYSIGSDINFEEIGITSKNIAVYSILDPEILNRLTPIFERIRRYDEIELNDLNPLNPRFG